MKHKSYLLPKIKGKKKDKVSSAAILPGTLRVKLVNMKLVTCK